VSQRDSGYERKERDLYETPEWVTEALRHHLPRQPSLVWEPAAGSGKMTAVLKTWGCRVVATDIDPNHICETANFLTCSIPDGTDAVITNPPYELATEFVQRALGSVGRGIVAMLLRTDFDHAKTRQYLFGGHKAFAKKVVLTKRIKWFEASKGQPSFNHAWFIWDWQHQGAPTLAYAP
jgi:methylase of polypeptide subunit release factors